MTDTTSEHSSLRPLSDTRWPEVNRARRDVLIVPTGSLEQHGPHLPLDTDTRIASAVASEVHRLRPGSGLAPALPLGASGEHSQFPGTLSIGTDVLATLIVELVRDACRHWNAVLIVNGHGGNVEALQRALSTCRDEGRSARVCHAGVPDSDAHAGRTETSVMMHLAIERVRLDLAVPGVTTGIAALLPSLRQDGVRAVSPTGVLGDPTGASAAGGAEILRRMVDSATVTYDLLTAELIKAGKPAVSGVQRVT